MVALTEPRALYGGAAAAHLPRGFLDASTVRQVPDHQEVFLDPNSTTSVVVEILDPREDETDGFDTRITTTGGSNEATAAQRHFALLAADNDAIQSTELYSSGPLYGTALSRSCPALIGSPEDETAAGSTAALSLCSGTQAIRKFNSTAAPDLVLVAVAVIQLPKHHSEILLSVNVPFSLAPQPASSSHDGDTATNSLLTVVSTAEDANKVARLVVDHFLQTFTINDWSLFSG